MEKKSREMFVQGLIGNAEIEKAEVRQVNLNINGEVKQCFVTSKRNDSKTGTVVEIRTIFPDETFDVLELDFVQNSLKTNKVRNTTYEYLGPVLNPKKISEREFDQIDINKFTVDVDGYCVPLCVILTPYFKEKAKNAVFMTAIKSLNLVDDKRVNTVVNDSKNSKKFEVNIYDNINISILDEKDNVVNVNSLSNKKLNGILKVNDNMRFMEIIANKDKTREPIVGGEARMENVVVNKNNDELTVEKVKERLTTVYNKYKDNVAEEMIGSILIADVILGETEFTKIEKETVFGAFIGKELKDAVTTPEGSMLVSDTFNKVKTINNMSEDEVVSELVNVSKIVGFENIEDKVSFMKGVVKTMQELTNSKIDKPEEEVERVEAEIVTDKARIEKVVNNLNKNEDKKEETSVIPASKSKYNSKNKVFVGMVKYIHDTMGDTGLTKYSDELTMIHKLLGKETIMDVAKNNKSVKEVLCKYTRNEINTSVGKGFDLVNELLNVLHKTILGYEDINVLANMPIDMKVKLVYLLLENQDMNLSDMTIEDRALFYIILRDSLLKVSVEDMLQGKSSGEFSIARARVSMQNKDIVIKYIA